MTVFEAKILSAIVATNFDQFFLFAGLHRTPIGVDPFLDCRIRFAVSVDVSGDGDIGNSSSSRGNLKTEKLNHCYFDFQIGMPH
jgi:hypothetical protein